MLGREVISRAQRFFPTLPIVLVALGENGFRSFAWFQTATLLALVQMEALTLREIDLDAIDQGRDDHLPF